MTKPQNRGQIVPLPSKRRIGGRVLSGTLTALLAFGGFQMGVALPHALKAQEAASNTASRLVLNITGYEGQTGQMMVALYADGAAFNNEARPFRDAKMTVVGAQTTVIFDGLPNGDYAFKLYHDVNGNGRLDTNGMGIPTEDYYFSNDASDPFSAPEWDEAVFSLPAGLTEREIDLS